MKEENVDTGPRELWICQWCRTSCIDYPTLREHLSTRCKVVRWRRKKLGYKRQKPIEAEEPRNLELEDFM